MIDPIETRPPFFTTLLNSRLYAVLAHVDAEGKLPEKGSTEGQGRIIFLDENACQALASNLWIACHEARDMRAGTTLQIYSPGNHLAQEIGGNRELNPWFDQLGSPSLVVSAFTSGITGADRAMAQAMADELSDITYMHALDALSNDALAHALYMNLRERISLEEHLANINELEGFAAASRGELGDEIRQFLSALSDPRDKLGRYNVYRKVLVVRAIQRRAKSIAGAKQDRVQEIAAAQNATAMYIADVDALAGRLATVLADKQPWWTGSAGILPSVNRRMRRAFANRLKGYVTSLDRICANPFRTWAILAKEQVQIMVDKLETEQLSGIGFNSTTARGYLEAMRAQERVSRGVNSVRYADGTNAAHEAFTSTIAWSLQTAPKLEIPGKKLRGVVHDCQLGQRTAWQQARIDALRAVEQGLADIADERLG